MSRGAQKQLSRTKDIPNPNEYVRALYGEFSKWTLDEEAAPQQKGQWREVFSVPPDHPLDLEIGTGNGYHFAWKAFSSPERCLIGLELKYKPLIQSIRRAVRQGCENARIARYNAVLVSELFSEQELNNVYIHHPDPWLKKSQWKHRLIQSSFLEDLYQLQRPEGEVEFKTDSEDYYDWALPLFKQSPYTVIEQSRDLHHSEYKDKNFVTHFERLFLKKGQPIFYCRLKR